MSGKKIRHLYTEEGCKFLLAWGRERFKPLDPVATIVDEELKGDEFWVNDEHGSIHVSKDIKDAMDKKIPISMLSPGAAKGRKPIDKSNHDNLEVHGAQRHEIVLEGNFFKDEDYEKLVEYLMKDPYAVSRLEEVESFSSGSFVVTESSVFVSPFVARQIKKLASDSAYRRLVGEFVKQKTKLPVNRLPWQDNAGNN